MSSSEAEAEFDDDFEDGEVNEDDQENDDDDQADDSDEEDEPLASLVESNGKDSPRKRSAAKISKSYAEDDDDDDESDSADDVPLSSLVPRKDNGKKNGSKTPTKSSNGSADKTKKKKAASPTPKKKVSATKKKLKKSDSRSSTATTTSSSTSGKKNYEWVSTAVYGTECDKGLLIQRLLCRWWYAYEWPDPNIMPKKIPKNHDTLDGFPGVYICTSGESVGKLKDLRNHDECPSFLNFLKKPSSELKVLLLKALNEQKRILIDSEGGASATEKELNKLMQWTTKLNPDKADKEIQKVLKAYKFTKYL